MLFPPLLVNHQNSEYNSKLVTSLANAERLGVDLLAGRKDDHAPATWTKPIMTNKPTSSFTTGKSATIMAFGDGTERNDAVANCDDFLASADTTIEKISEDNRIVLSPSYFTPIP